jgi:GT2 family glycosyltransferase
MIEENMNRRKISLIFVNYRSIFSLSRALRFLPGDSFPPAEREIIVVNQDGAERTAIGVLAEQQGFRLVQRENLGFASGANAGAKRATGSYIAFLNPDARYFAGSFESIRHIFETQSEVGLIGATLRDASGRSEAWSRGRLLTIGHLILNNLFLRSVCIRGKHRESVDWVSGGALFVRRELFQSLGGFSEDFFLYFEDMDLCARARQAGFSVRSSELLSFLHAGGKSFTTKRSQKKHFFDSQQKYFRKHRPFWEQQLFFFLRIIKIW